MCSDEITSCSARAMSDFEELQGVTYVCYCTPVRMTHSISSSRDTSVVRKIRSDGEVISGFAGLGGIRGLACGVHNRLS